MKPSGQLSNFIVLAEKVTSGISSEAPLYLRSQRHHCPKPFCSNRNFQWSFCKCQSCAHRDFLKNWSAVCWYSPRHIEEPKCKPFSWQTWGIGISSSVSHSAAGSFDSVFHFFEKDLIGQRHIENLKKFGFYGRERLSQTKALFLMRLKIQLLWFSQNDVVGWTSWSWSWDVKTTSKTEFSLQDQQGPP